MHIFTISMVFPGILPDFPQETPWFLPQPGWSSALVASLALLAALLTQPDAGPMSLANQLRLAEAAEIWWL